MTSLNKIARQLSAEFIGTGLLLAIVVGSGIMGTRLGGGPALALLANSLATGAGLMVLILVFGPYSGAHFNPVVSVYKSSLGEISVRHCGAYIIAQCAGGLAGVALAHGMFGLPVFSEYTRVRDGMTGVLSEAVATFGLILTIRSCERHHPTITPFAVGLYILSAYWFTSSTSFANPAVTVARMFTDTFAGIRAVDAPAFILGQVLGATLAALYIHWLERNTVE